jgi:hypothetical protein
MPVSTFDPYALAGHLTAVHLLSKLVQLDILPPTEAADLLDGALLTLEKFQSAFHEEHRETFEEARRVVDEWIVTYRTGDQ